MQKAALMLFVAASWAAAFFAYRMRAESENQLLARHMAENAECPGIIPAVAGRRINQR